MVSVIFVLLIMVLLLIYIMHWLVLLDMCTDYVDPAGLTVFTACRLIALDKCPGVRPIGVCEMVRRIIGKAILSVIGVEIQQSAGSLQLCAGQPSGCKAAIHALRHIFDDVTTEAALLVDASNALNNLNCWLALANISTLCPAFLLTPIVMMPTCLLEVRLSYLRRE